MIYASNYIRNTDVRYASKYMRNTDVIYTYTQEIRLSEYQNICLDFCFRLVEHASRAAEPAQSDILVPKVRYFSTWTSFFDFLNMPVGQLMPSK